jgi:tRNA1(Val) A37 N6-methylase TrmN6
MANPPFLPAIRADRRKTSARTPSDVEGEADLKAWVDCALRRVKPRGTVTFIHRADRLDALLAALEGRAGGITVLPLWPKQGMAAKRVIVRARQGVATPLILSPGLVLHCADGAYTQEAEHILRGGAALDIGSIGRPGAWD